MQWGYNKGFLGIKNYYSPIQKWEYFTNSWINTVTLFWNTPTKKWEYFTNSWISTLFWNTPTKKWEYFINSWISTLFWNTPTKKWEYFTHSWNDTLFWYTLTINWDYFWNSRISTLNWYSQTLDEYLWEGGSFWSLPLPTLHHQAVHFFITILRTLKANPLFKKVVCYFSQFFSDFREIWNLALTETFP